MTIKKLEIRGWNQFENINLDLHPRITIITGENGVGKSTIIRLISKVIGWEYREIGIPVKDESSMKSSFSSGIRYNFFPQEDKDNNFSEIQIGVIKTDSGEYKIRSPKNNHTPIYNLSMPFTGNGDIKPFGGNTRIKGLSIPSHRQQFSYNKLESIPVRPKSKEEAFSEYLYSLQKRSFSTDYYDPTKEIPNLHMKSTLISLALFGQGNNFVTPDNKSLELFLGFIDILKLLLPQKLGFREINVVEGEIVLMTDTGKFLLDAVSGGIGALIDIAWQIYMYDKGKNDPFVVLIDEAENHLHPSMQRTLLPNLLNAFKHVQFIVSTHSPFIVNSVKQSSVYALKYTENRGVVSELLDFENKAATANQILRDILGVPITLPIWVEENLKRITDKYSSTQLTKESYQNLKADLEGEGLTELLPQAISFLDGGEKK
ncbi:ATP-binding protein [Bacillus sp. CMF12]|uniref:AAA family ATPase n=1 Tax=Bacillus sp. CMF12 TaxID=2884834 RepID=UPI00207A5B87|nr:ATP-binding protein [Bacillus sp. CMF12]USK48881.1 ATP-binding protein [Bacillus sp. CMF12]